MNYGNSISNTEKQPTKIWQSIFDGISSGNNENWEWFTISNQRQKDSKGRESALIRLIHCFFIINNIPSHNEEYKLWGKCGW